MKPMHFAVEMTETAYRLSRKTASMPVCFWHGDSSVEKSCARKSFNRNVQSTVSLCVGILLFTIVLFVLCAIDPSTVSEEPWRITGGSGIVVTLPHRPWRALQMSSTLNPRLGENGKEGIVKEDGTALEGMGTLFRRGSGAMNELVVAHLSENTCVSDLRLFLRTLHRSGMPARADVVLLFPWRPLPVAMADVIHEEERSFQKLVADSKSDALAYHSARQKRRNQLGEDGGPMKGNDRALHEENTTSIAVPTVMSNSSISMFNAAAYWKAAEQLSQGRGDSMWGGSNHSSLIKGRNGESEWAGWGSTVGFDMQELDPDDALRGFLDDSPVELRRWICYQMLLGVVRQKYRHVLLTEVRGVFVLEDALAPAKKKESDLFLFSQDRKWGDIAVDRDFEKSKLASRSDSGEGKRRILTVRNKATNTGKLDGEIADRVEEVQEGHVIEVEGEEGGLKNSQPVPVKPAQRASIKGPVMKNGRGHHSKGLIEEVYGKELWSSLDKEEKENRVLSTGVIIGGVRPMRSLANAMATEIVRVALQRKNRRPFHDEALLNYLVLKSSVLGRKVISHLQVLGSRDSPVHLLSGSNQSSVFFRHNGAKFAVIQGYQNQALIEERRRHIAATVHDDICHSPADSRVYKNCL